jgi:hypothetical protein
VQGAGLKAEAYVRTGVGAYSMRTWAYTLMRKWAYTLNTSACHEIVRIADEAA